MRKLIPLVLFLLVLVSPSAVAQTVTVEPQDIVTDIRAISKLFPRTEGSVGEDQLISLIKERLNVQGIQYKETDFSEAAGFHSFSRILTAEIPGSGDEFLTLVAPLNQPRWSDPGWGSVNIALALGLLKNHGGTEFPVGLRVFFLGGEFTDDAPLGSQEVLSLFSPDTISPFFYLAFEAPPKILALKAGGEDTVCPRWFLEESTDLLTQSGIDARIRGAEIQFSRFGFGESPSLIQPYLRAGFPALLMTGEGSLAEGEWHDWISLMLLFFTRFLDSSTPGFTAEVDTHYLFFQWGDRPVIIPETEYMAALIIVLAALLLYPFFARRRFRRYTWLIRHHLWILPALVALTYLFLLLGTLSVDALLLASNNSELWKAAPVPLYLFKFSGALLFTALLYGVFKRLPFSRKGNFYSAAALQLLFVDLLVISFINISFSYYILWTFLFTFLFTILRRKELKLTALVISMVWLFVFLVQIFSYPQEDLIRILLLSRVKGNLLQALILLPFIFLIIRLSFLFFVPRKRTRKVIFRATLGILAAAWAGLFIFLLALNPYGPDNPQPITVADQIWISPQRRLITASSPAPLLLDTLSYQGEAIPLDPGGRSSLYSTDRLPPSPEILLSQRLFLRRREVNISILPRDDGATPALITLQIDSPEEVVILDSNFPYTLGIPDTEGLVKIHVGANPPLPQTVSLIVPDTQTMELTVSVVFHLPREDHTVEGHNYRVEGLQTYRQSFSLPTGEETDTPDG
jgi:hypothetical protein